MTFEELYKMTKAVINPRELSDDAEAGSVNDNQNICDIYLAGGCFWGVQAYFDRIPGVVETEVGYANGKTETASYHELWKTGHAETVHVKYDADKTTLEKILEYYFRVVDPTILNRQGPDIGTQYRTGIYYVDPKDKEIIEKVISKEAQKYDKPIVTEVEKLKHFIKAEEYHQKYLKKNPGGYCHIDLSLANED
jgi:peptide methionine sulfoxide reductase msrA/msrB